MQYYKKGTIFLDRDGVLIKEVDYLSSLTQIEIFDESFEAIKMFNQAGFHVIVISNQSGVARGYFSLEFVNDCHLFIQNKLRLKGAIIDQLYFCPHYADGEIKEFSITCDCRKPGIGLINRARKQFPTNLGNSFIIGDKLIDIQTGIIAGIKPVLVKTGYGEETAHINRVFLIENNVWICDNILEAAKKILT